MALFQIRPPGSASQIVAGSALTGGDVYSDDGIFGVVHGSVDSGAVAVIDHGGLYDVTKVAGTAWGAGDRIKWNGTAFDKSTAGTYHAVAELAATSGATSGRVRFLETPAINPGILAQSYTVRIPVVANSAPTYLWAPPVAGSVASIKIACTTTIASTSGTVLLAGIKVGGNTLLATASTDIEGTVGAAAPATVPLTATAADLVLAATDVVKLTVTSNNADATGGGDLIAIITMTPA